MSGERPESKLIRKKAADIAELISNGGAVLVAWFAARLAGEAFIASAQQFNVLGVDPFTQVTQMLGAVEAVLKATGTPEEKLKSFIGILKAKLVLEDLVKPLITEYESYGGTAFQSSSGAGGSSDGAGSSSSTLPGNLTVDDLVVVQEELYRARNHWYNMGLKLGLKVDVLSSIRSQWRSPDDCFREMLTKYLQTESPSWRALVDALRSRIISQPQLALKMEQKFCRAPKLLETENTSPPLPQEPFSIGQETTTPTFSPGTDSAISFTFDDVKVMSDGGGLKYECFEPCKHDKKTKLKLSFGTVEPLRKSRRTDFEGYDMKRFPHGLCLIINNEEFSRQDPRKGTAIDEKNLVQTFRFLGYKVEVHRDRTVAQMESIFEGIRLRDHSKHDSLVCCILSHGIEGKVYGSDSKVLDITAIASKLNGENCKMLAGKPKLFFLQACRGGGKDAGARVASDSGGPSYIPKEADFFFGYATPPGNVAYRHFDYGSWYVSELCRSLCTHATYADLNHMVQETHRKVGDNYRTEGFTQAPETTTRLRKDVYFF